METQITSFISFKISRFQKMMRELQNYYGQPHLKKTRIYAGPLIILIGYILYWFYTEPYLLAFAGFCIGYGLYYSMKPIIFAIFRYKKNTEEAGEIFFNDKYLTLSNFTGDSAKDKGNNHQTIIISQILSASIKSGMFSLVFIPNNIRINIPIASITNGNAEDFCSNLTKRIIEAKKIIS